MIKARLSCSGPWRYLINEVFWWCNKFVNLLLIHQFEVFILIFKKHLIMDPSLNSWVSLAVNEITYPDQWVIAHFRLAWCIVSHQCLHHAIVCLSRSFHQLRIFFLQWLVFWRTNWTDITKIHLVDPLRIKSCQVLCQPHHPTITCQYELILILQNKVNVALMPLQEFIILNITWLIL